MPDLFGDSVDITIKAKLPKQLINTASLEIKLDPNLKVKELISEIKWLATHVKVEYIDQLLTFQNHKSVAVRRAVLNALATIGNQSTAAKLEFWRAGEFDRNTLILLNSTIDKLSRQTNDLVKDRNTLQVGEFLTTIKQLIGTKNFVVEGEVAEISIYHQVIYFALKDKTSGEKLDCMAYYNVLERLKFTLNEGLSIKVTGKASLAKNSSKLRLNVTYLELTGEGEFLRNLKILHAKLEQEGLFDQSRKRQLNILPQKIALLVSPGSAAESDFIKVLNERRSGVEICVVPIKTQGESALKILLDALSYTNTQIKNPFSSLFGTQTVIITRGGGSASDLLLFNQEQIARAIYALTVPTLVAIGHEKDVSLAELAADVRASTPTQAAMMVSLSKYEVASILNQNMLKLQLWMNQKYSSYDIFTQKQSQLISKHIGAQIYNIEITLNSFKNLSTSLLQNWQNRVDKIYLNIVFNFKTILDLKSETLKHFENQGFKLQNRIDQLSRAKTAAMTSINNNFYTENQAFLQKFSNLTQDIALYDPSKILGRGYALLKNQKTGKVIEKWSDWHNEKVVIVLEDGSKNASID